MRGLLIMTVLLLILALAPGVEVDAQRRLRPLGGVVAAELIPTDRLVSWVPGTDVGVPGGIPTTRTQCVTSACQDLTNAAAGYLDGTLDAEALIQAAITSALADTYVQIPCGADGGPEAWKVLGNLVMSATDDSVTLRGCGPDETIINCDFDNSGTACLMVGSQADFFWPVANSHAIESYSGDCATVTISDASAYSANQLLRFVWANDLTIPVVHVEGIVERRAQMTRVVSKTGTTLTVFPPIYECAVLAGVSGRVNRASAQSDSVGVEDLTLDGEDNTLFALIWIDQTFGNWVKNVTLREGSNHHLYIVSSVQCEARYNTIGPGGTGASNGSAVLTANASGCLIEDNILQDVQPLTEINSGSAGNVIAYNFGFLTNGAQVSFDTNHNPHNRFNLFEGNIGPSLISDGLFGGESGPIIFRNYLHGNGEVGTGFGSQASHCVNLKRFTRTPVLIGNVLGGSTWKTSCLDTRGRPNIGNSNFIGEVQPSQGDYWAHLNLSGPTVAGTLTTRTSDTAGQITLSSGQLDTICRDVGQCDEATMWTAASTTAACCKLTISTIVGSVVTFTNTGVLPALDEPVTIWAGQAGYQETDLDVEATLVSKANWDVFAATVIGSSLGGATVPASLFRSAKPAYFNSLTWPPIDYLAPSISLAVIPAGYRYLNAGADPP